MAEFREMSEDPIPFNRHPRVEGDVENLRSSLGGGHCSGAGPWTEQCEEILGTVLGVEQALLTTSCTHALEMAAILLDVGPGDEVIVPSYTFVSTANAFALRGAAVKFCDVRADTMNLDENALKDLVSPSTKAVVPVHYAGVGCEMDAINEISNQNGIAVVEDNAHGLFGKYKGRWLGSFGVMATQSFHETKNFSSGEGGALLINDAVYSERAEIIREKGTNRSQFFRGQIDKYSWVDLGSSYVMSDILASILFRQLECREMIGLRRRELWTCYAERLKDWSNRNGVKLPFIPDHCEQTHHLFYLMMPDLLSRAAFIEHMRARSVDVVFHYLPLHASPYGVKLGGRPGQCPVAETVSDRIVRIPLFYNLSDEEQDRVIDGVLSFEV